MQFWSSIALVIGPTPPMRGVSQPATSATSSATSERSLRPSKETPAPTTTAPGLTMSAVIRPGAACRRDQNVGLTRVVAKVSHAGVDHRHRSVGVRLLERQQVGERAADGEAPPDDDHVTTLDLDAVPLEQHLDTDRSAGSGAGLAHHQAAEVHGVQAVGILGRVHRQQHLAVVEAGGDRVLHQIGVHVRVGVERGHLGQHVGLGRGGGEMAVERCHPYRLAVLVFHVHVAGRRAVVSHQDGAQPRRGSPGDEGGGPLPHLGPKLRRHPLAIQHLCRHGRRRYLTAARRPGASAAAGASRSDAQCLK